MKEFFNPFISGSDKPDLDGDDINQNYSVRENNE